MNKRLKKKMAKVPAHIISKGELMDAIDTIIHYGEQTGHPTDYDCNGTRLRTYDIDIFDNHAISVTTTCSDIDEILKPILNYKKRW